MIAMELQNTKDCMGKLLIQNTFDHFLFIEGQITTYNKFIFDGYLRKHFYNEEEMASLGNRNYSYWRDMKETCFSLIKGKRTPLDFQFVFGLSLSQIEQLIESAGISLKPEEVGGLFFNLKFDGNVLTATTGTSIKTFTMDKSLEHTWDDYIQRFLKKSNIELHIL